MVSETRERIAAEARERIELIRSRMPKRPFRKETARPATEAERLVVISDIHLGDPLNELTEPACIDTLVTALQNLGPIDELVLLGDVFDFWQSPFHEAIARGRDLMGALFGLDNVGRMTYIPGNHDHHVVRMHLEERVARNLREGELEPPPLTIPLTDDCPVMDPLRPEGARVPLYMAYPMHRVRVRGRDVLLTHGHMLGVFEGSLWRRRKLVSALLMSKDGTLDMDDIERFITPYYEMVALSTYMPGVVDGRYRFYRFVARTSRVMGLEKEGRVSAYRDTTVEQNAVEVEALLDRFSVEMPDFFVYGHTHKAGRLTLPLSGVTAINTGCWLGDRGMNDARDTLVEITDDSLILTVDEGGQTAPAACSADFDV